MRIAEFIGPSGAGKSAIYKHMLDHGGFVQNPKMGTEYALELIEGVKGQDSRLDDFVSFLSYLERTGTGDRHVKRVGALYRALAKDIAARLSPQDGRWMVIDGGLVHRGQSVDRITPAMPLDRYYEMLPMPDIVFAVQCPKEELARRNESRGGSHDRRDDIDRSVACFEKAVAIMRKRGVTVIPVHSGEVPVDKAARACLTRLGILRKYEGAEAENYDSQREDKPKWQIEQRVVENMLGDLPTGTVILDAPVGTGRFIEFYEKNRLVLRGLDRSADMLMRAGSKVKDPTSIINGDCQFAFMEGDVRKTRLDDNSVDVAVCVRITRWLFQEFGPDGVCDMLREMQRVARQRIVFTTRVRDHPYAVRYDIINSALDGWRIFRDEAGYEDAYRIIELRPIEKR